mmetsp:Transcript_21614/g.20738  ORF Transcript_21614/g.20738 Transcript_21614/m.20738 type:complete len:316 (-) Transcript_21614:1951-2898(-)
MVIESVEVVREALINLEVSNPVVAGEASEEGVDLVSEEDEDEEDPEEDQQRHSWVVVSTLFEDAGPDVASLLDVAALDDVVDVVVGDELQVAYHPVPEGAQEDWGPGHDPQHPVVQLVVVHRRLSVGIVDHELLHNVQNQVLNHSNGPHHGDTKSVHEGDEGDVEDGGILVVDEVDGSTVKLNILLEGGALGLVGVAADDSSVKGSESESHSPVHEEFHQRPVDVELHGIDHGVSDIIEPGVVKVRDEALEDESEDGSLFLHVSVGGQEQEGSVEELHDEDAISDHGGLFGLSVVSDVDDQGNDDQSEHVVDSDD